MAVTNFYTVRWHREVGAYGSKKLSQYGEQRQDHVAAAAGDTATLTAVLAGKYTTEAGNIVLDSVGNAGPGSALS